MTSFKLVLDPDSIERRQSGPAVGAVHAAFGAKAFPDAGWSDFALEFLKAYWQAVLKLRKATTSSVSFYEGPFKLRFRRTGEQVTIDALTRDEVVHTARLDYTDLLEHSMQSILPWIEHEHAVSTR